MSIKAQGTSDHAGYFFIGYGCFPDPYVTGLIYKDPDIRKFRKSRKFEIVDTGKYAC